MTVAVDEFHMSIAPPIPPLPSISCPQTFFPLPPTAGAIRHFVVVTRGDKQLSAPACTAHP